jgi:hypothetical protein
MQLRHKWLQTLQATVMLIPDFVTNMGLLWQTLSVAGGGVGRMDLDNDTYIALKLLQSMPKTK